MSDTPKINASRSQALDVLRCLAILLVLANHAPGLPDTAPGVFRWLGGMGRQFGWMGVDLFFVLSGFLISGLLFREYQQYGEIQFKRFFIRRGFKIYPPLYSIAALISVLVWVKHHDFPWSRALGEVFFLQNYWASLLPQSWSLAVEEHFYLTLPWFLIFLARRSPDRQNPFRAIPKLFVITAVIVLSLRLITVRWWPVAAEDQMGFTMRHIFPTHLRIDSLFFGVVLSYFHHFQTAGLLAWAAKHRGRLALVSGACLAPPLFLRMEATPFIYTFGFTLLYLGFGALLLLVVTQGLPQGRWLDKIMKAASFVGFYSYSIYLWHLLVRTAGVNFQEQGLPWWLVQPVYLAACIVTGIIMAKLVELPFLKLRDRFFPSRSKPLHLAERSGR